MKYKSIIIYLLLGLCTTIVNVVAYYLCYVCICISNVGSTIIAWVIAVFFAFLTNKPLVFNSHQWSPSLVMVEGAKFFVGRLATGTLDVVGMYILVNLLHFDGTLMKFLLNIIIVMVNYIFSMFVVFNKK